VAIFHAYPYMLLADFDFFFFHGRFSNHYSCRCNVSRPFVTLGTILTSRAHSQ
jgi:hypothetical protein